MSIGYRISDQDGVYFHTFQIVINKNKREQMKWIILLLNIFLLFNSCVPLDKRLIAINYTGHTGYCQMHVGKKNYIRILTCEDFSNYKKDHWLTKNYDTSMLYTVGNWDDLLEKDRVLVNFFDSAKFENYCKGIIPIDSTYNKYYFTKKELIDNNWTIILKQ